MRKYTPYIVGSIILLLIVFIIITTTNRKASRRLDERITLRERDEIPYGFAAAKKLSKNFFPSARIVSDEESPGYWSDISVTSNKQAVIVVAGYFNADDYEIKRMMRFVENGNYLFIIGQSFSEEAQSAFRISVAQNVVSAFTGVHDDSLRVRMAAPYFRSDSFYVYPGRKFESWLQKVDTNFSAILGYNERFPNFIRMNKGDGAFFIHTAPLAFSNYFILHKNNIHYFEQAMSVIPADVHTVIWNEFYLEKRQPLDKMNDDQRREPNWLGVLLRYPEFRWGFSMLLLLLLLWVLLNSRRRQRMIPGHAQLRNESLDFVKTMGRLYYVRKDHQNLAKKMSSYFLEHVRSTYKLPTHTLDEHFIDTLRFKSGHPQGDLNEIVSFVQYLQDNGSVNETQLIHFYNQLETFYQNT